MPKEPSGSPRRIPHRRSCSREEDICNCPVLKVCPFCGEKQGDNDQVYWEGSRVICGNCGATGPSNDFGHENIYSWNERDGHDRLTRRVAQLEETLRTIEALNNTGHYIEGEPGHENTVSHDHRYNCRECGKILRDNRDCTCPSQTGLTLLLCGYCMEQREYDRTEAKRNANY